MKLVKTVIVDVERIETDYMTRGSRFAGGLPAVALCEPNRRLTFARLNSLRSSAGNPRVSHERRLEAILQLSLLQQLAAARRQRISRLRRRRGWRPRHGRRAR